MTTPTTRASLDRQLRRAEEAVNARLGGLHGSTPFDDSVEDFDWDNATLCEMRSARVRLPAAFQDQMLTFMAAWVIAVPRAVGGQPVPFWDVCRYPPGATLPRTLVQTLTEVRDEYSEDVAWSAARAAYCFYFGEATSTQLRQDRDLIFNFLITAGDVTWSRLRKLLWEQFQGQWRLKPKWQSAADEAIPYVVAIGERLTYTRNFERQHVSKINR